MGRTTTGQILRRERLAREQSQQDIALAIGVAKSAICQWEREVYEPSLESLRALARVWRMSVHELVGERNATRLAKQRRRTASGRRRAKVSAQLNSGKRGEAEADA